MLDRSLARVDGEDPLEFLRELSLTNSSRRKFLTWAGVVVAASLVGCSKDKNPISTGGGVNLGTGDTAVLNYAYALEQLEAAFYTKVIVTPFTGMTAAEATLLTDIRDHELIHRNFLRSALGASAIADLSFSFTTVDFHDRTSVLNTAKAFEDLGVSAYNGAGQLISSDAYLVLAGKIVSVEARHASAIRDLIAPKTAAFAGDDVVAASTGLDGQRPPSQVLVVASTYISTSINRGDLP